MQLVLDSYRDSSFYAGMMFPGHEVITYSVFRRALLLFFRKLYKLPIEEKNQHFDNNYFSENGLVYFTINNIKYFNIVIDKEITSKKRFYGKINLKQSIQNENDSKTQ